MQRQLIPLSELSKDQYNQILSPIGGSLSNGTMVALGLSGDIFSCCRVQGDTITVSGPPLFVQNIKAAFPHAKPTVWFGSAQKERPPQQCLSPVAQTKTDTTSATTYRVPVRIYKSSRAPGKNYDGTPAEDMQAGTMTADQIKKMPMYKGVLGDDMFIDDLEHTNPKTFFSSFRTMTVLFATGDLKMNIFSMIAKFEKSEGGEYRNQALTNAVKAHDSTIKFSDTIIKDVKSKLSQIDGDINKLKLDELMWMYKKTAGFRLPIFNTAWDKVEGLTIAINDVWAGRAEITKYDKFGKFYKGNIRVTLYDHFGLDYPDIGPDSTSGRTKPYGLLAGFRSWFVLQHYDKFAYKPFMTVIELDYPFQGELP